jgi:hypothetical protein
MKVTHTGLMRKRPSRIVGDFRDAYVGAVGSAMGRSIASAKTQAKREVSAAASVKQKAVGGRVSGKRLPGGQTVRMYYNWSKMPLEAFSAPRQTKRGVRAGKHFVDGAFLSQSTRGRSAGKTTVFKRRGQARGPIERQGLNMEKHQQRFVVASRRGFFKTYDKRFDHEYRRRLKRKGLA